MVMTKREHKKYIETYKFCMLFLKEEFGITPEQLKFLATLKELPKTDYEHIAKENKEKAEEKKATASNELFMTEFLPYGKRETDN